MVIRGRVQACLSGVAIAMAIPIGAQQSDTSASSDTRPAILIGYVRDGAGVGLSRAEITLRNADNRRVITSDSGTFRFTGIPPGTRVFDVRRLGFEPASFTAVLKPGRTHRATLSLSQAPQALPAVAVSDTGITSHWLDQFEARRSRSRGTFITRADIERRGARSGTDIVRTVAGVRVAARRDGAGNQVVMTRGSGVRACIPTMYVHGVPYSGGLDDFAADDIEALEVYVGVSEIPAEFDKNGRGICGVIVVWTRDPRKPLSPP